MFLAQTHGFRAVRKHCESRQMPVLQIQAFLMSLTPYAHLFAVLLVHLIMSRATLRAASATLASLLTRVIQIRKYCCLPFGAPIVAYGVFRSLGTPGTGVTVSDINFTGSANTISVDDSAQRVAVNCGSGSCTGTWDWSELTVSGGTASTITGFSGISGGSY